MGIFSIASFHQNTKLINSDLFSEINKLLVFVITEVIKALEEERRCQKCQQPEHCFSSPLHTKIVYFEHCKLTYFMLISVQALKKCLYAQVCLLTKQPQCSGVLKLHKFNLCICYSISAGKRSQVWCSELNLETNI